MIRFAPPLAASVIWASVAVAAGPHGSIHVGLWNGGAYTDDTTGKFSHCAAGAPYVSGVNLIVSLTVGGEWLMGFGHPSWHYPKGQTVPIDVTFDGQAQFHLAAGAINNEALGAPLPKPFVERLRKASLMMASINGQTYQFNLTSTGHVLSVIANCVAQVKTKGLASAGDFSVLPARTAPPVVATPTKSISKTSDPAPASNPTKLVDTNGTGFVISSNGHILTANHVIADCVTEVRGNLTGESPVALRIVSKDETNDLALLQASKPFKDVAVIRGTSVRSGDTVIAIGYPYHGLLTSDFTVGAVAGVVGIEGGVVSEVINLESSGVEAPDRRPRHEQYYHEGRFLAA